MVPIIFYISGQDITLIGKN